MYEQTYGLSGEPFRLSPDPGFVYEHKAYSKAHAYMTYAFMRAEGFVMITGRPGTGKTTLISTLLQQLDQQTVTTANLVCTQLQADDLLKMVAWDFGVDPTVVSKGELIDRLARRLKDGKREGKRALLVVDEAQDLSLSAMEELRLLTNIQENARPLIQIFLLGQPQLRELILRPELEQVHQRIIAATHLQGLGEADTRAYILHRLKVVGWRGDPALSEALYPLIHRFSEGVPRRINLICSRLLLHSAVEGQHRIGVADLRLVLRELQGEDLAAGNGLQERDFQVEDRFPAPGENGTADAPSRPGGGRPWPDEHRTASEQRDCVGARRTQTIDPDGESSRAEPFQLRLVAGQRGAGRVDVAPTPSPGTGSGCRGRRPAVAGPVPGPEGSAAAGASPGPARVDLRPGMATGELGRKRGKYNKRRGRPPMPLVIVLLSVLLVTLALMLRENHLF